MEHRVASQDGKLCPCGRTAVVIIDGTAYCDHHKTKRTWKTIEWDQLSILGEPPKREKASWLE